MPRAHDPGAWPHRLALWCALASLPLVLFGGSVTTLGAGMAVDGWLIAEGHFLLFFPVEEWFRDTATFVEHTHRLFGVLVGLLAIACVACTYVSVLERRSSARLAASLALLAVGVQGTLGGLRVLADDSGLAFLHGALAQAVFALLCVNAVVLSAGWQRALAVPARDAQPLRALRSAGLLALLVLYGQVVLGAWYRHGLRPAAVAGSGLRLALHALGALLVVGALVVLARRAAALRAARALLPVGFERALRALPVLLIAQLILGCLAWAGYRPGALGPAEWALSILHVLGGGLLLADGAVIWMWSGRLTAAAPAPERVGAAGAVWKEAL